jgi:hypothetical protein
MLKIDIKVRMFDSDIGEPHVYCEKQLEENTLISDGNSETSDAPF